MPLPASDPSSSVEKEMGTGNGQDGRPLGFRSRLSSARGQEGVSRCRIRAAGAGVLRCTGMVGLRLSLEASSLGRRALDLPGPCSVPT